MEISAYNSYRELGFNINFWRTKSGLEVDFVLGDGAVALEIKGSSSIQNRDLTALKRFSEDYSPQFSIIVCNEREERISGKIKIMPWKEFLKKLWNGTIIS